MQQVYRGLAVSKTQSDWWPQRSCHAQALSDAHLPFPGRQAIAGCAVSSHFLAETPTCSTARSFSGLAWLTPAITDFVWGRHATFHFFRVGFKCRSHLFLMRRRFRNVFFSDFVI